MSDSNTSNPQDKQGESDPDLSKYELITAYLDGELKNPDEVIALEKEIESNPDLYNRFLFEKLSKERFKKSSQRTETPLYVRLKISEGIENYIQRASGKKPATSNVGEELPQLMPETTVVHSQQEKQSLFKYLMYGSGVFAILVASIIYFSGMFDSTPQLASNDLVEVSRQLFKKCDGKNNVQIKTSDAKALADSMNKYLDFHVYIPEAREAELVGGTCNEMNGEKLAHIIHRKGDVIIYTLQGNKDHVMNTQGNIILCPDFMEKVSSGANWFTCLKEKNAVAIIWYKGNVISSTVSDMDSKDLTAIFAVEHK